MPNPVYPAWRETLPIPCQPTPGTEPIQPTQPNWKPDVYLDVCNVQYPTQVAATTARTNVEATGVQSGYYGVFQRWDGFYQLWPAGLRPVPGVQVA